MYKLKMLWHSNYWDGPISGLAELDGEKVWFEMAEDYGPNIDMSEEIFEKINTYLKPKGLEMIKYPTELFDDIINKMIDTCRSIPHLRCYVAILKNEDTLTELHRQFNGCVYSLNSFECIDVDALLEDIKLNTCMPGYYYDIYAIQCSIDKHLQSYVIPDALLEEIELHVLKERGLQFADIFSSVVQTKKSYDVFRLPKENIAQLEYCEETSAMMYGYHAYHLPEMRNKPFQRNPQLERQYYMDPAPAATRFSMVAPEKLEKLGSFYYDDFQYYHRQ